MSFAGTATTLVSPTPDHNATKAAVDKLQLDDKTATGEGIFAALDQIRTLNSLLGGEKEAPPAHIVLLSDGKQTVPESQDAPRGVLGRAQSAERRVPISTISFGTRSGVVEIEGERIPVPVDDASRRRSRSSARQAGGSSPPRALRSSTRYTARCRSRSVRDDARRRLPTRGYWRARFWPLLSAAGALLLNQRLP